MSVLSINSSSNLSAKPYWSSEASSVASRSSWFKRISMISFAVSTLFAVSLRLACPDLNLSSWTTSFSMARLAWALWTMDSSIVFLVTRRNITTGRVWPIRWQRSWGGRRKKMFSIGKIQMSVFEILLNRTITIFWWLHDYLKD